MTGTADTATLPGTRAWLLSDRPQSRTQARLGRAYMAWLRFSANRTALIGSAGRFTGGLTYAFIRAEPELGIDEDASGLLVLDDGLARFAEELPGRRDLALGLVQQLHQVIKRQRTGHFIGMKATLQIDLGPCAGRAPVMPGQASRGSRTWPRQGNILGLHLHLWSD